MSVDLGCVTKNDLSGIGFNGAVIHATCLRFMKNGFDLRCKEGLLSTS